MNGNSLRRGSSKSCHYKNRARFKDGNIPVNKKKIEYEVNENGCWICTSHSKQKDGYVMLRDGGKKITMHRYMYKKYKGDIPNGMCVCHSCDTPECVNPTHLFLGTHKENMEDRNKKERQLKGIDTPNSRLTESQVLEIRNSKEPNRQLGLKYGVSSTVIWSVKNRKTWKHVKEDHNDK